MNTKRKQYPWEKKVAAKKKAREAREAKRLRLLADASKLMERARVAWAAAQVIAIESEPHHHQWSIGPLTIESRKPTRLSNMDALGVPLLCDECGDTIVATVTGETLMAHRKEHGDCSPAKRGAAAERRAFYRGVGCAIIRNEYSETK